MRLRNRVAIVTGACRGIGSAIAAKLLDESARVFLTCSHGAHFDELIASAELSRQSLKCAQVDVTQKAQIVQAVHRCIEEWGRIDILVNNAGVPGVEKGSE